MSMHQSLAGVYAAALTPILPDFSLSFDDIHALFSFLANRGCHGALLFGTTGEGPSFSLEERLNFFRLAVDARQEFPHFRLLGGTGTPSLEETIELTRAAFESGLDGVVVLPPYYYRKVSDEGLYAWYQQVLQKAVPQGSALFAYHIPNVSGVPLSIDLLSRLKDGFPDRFAGVKDSSGDPEHARTLGERFGKELIVFTGNDKLFSTALGHYASGCITALCNLCSLDLRAIWDAHQNGESHAEAQARLTAARIFLDRYPPAPPLLKFMISQLHEFPRWAVRPPLIPLAEEVEKRVMDDFQSIASAFV